MKIYKAWEPPVNQEQQGIRFPEMSILEEMVQTMLDNNGIGLSSNQVGIAFHSFAIIDITDLDLKGKLHNLTKFSDNQVDKDFLSPLDILGRQILVIISPSYLPLSPLSLVQEGCLSVLTTKDVRKLTNRAQWRSIRRLDLLTPGCLQSPILTVKRYHKIITRFLGLDGTQYGMEIEGDLAQIIQHETDHLNGICIVDRCKQLIT